MVFLNTCNCAWKLGILSNQVTYRVVQNFCKFHERIFICENIIVNLLFLYTSTCEKLNAKILLWRFSWKFSATKISGYMVCGLYKGSASVSQCTTLIKQSVILDIIFKESFYGIFWSLSSTFILSLLSLILFNIITTSIHYHVIPRYITYQMCRCSYRNTGEWGGVSWTDMVHCGGGVGGIGNDHIYYTHDGVCGPVS